MNISTSPYNQSPIHSSAGTSHGTSRSYMVGFIISVILTVIPFGLVMYPTLPRSVTAWVVVALGVVQVFAWAASTTTCWRTDAAERGAALALCSTIHRVRWKIIKPRGRSVIRSGNDFGDRQS
jgi:hypothetical protein